MFKHRIIFILGLVVLVGVFIFYAYQQGVTPDSLRNPGTPVVRIGDVAVRVEIADTPALRSRGLSGKRSLEVGTGMLFVFETADYHGIWMKDMLFPIDVFWISEDLRIVWIEKNLQPNSFPKSFMPPGPAKYVLETTARYAETFNISVGQTVTLPPTIVKK